MKLERHPLLTLRFTFQTLAVFFCFVLCFGFGGFVALLCFWFPVLQVFWNPEFSAQFRPR